MSCCYCKCNNKFEYNLWINKYLFVYLEFVKILIEMLINFYSWNVVKEIYYLFLCFDVLYYYYILFFKIRNEYFFIFNFF